MESKQREQAEVKDWLAEDSELVFGEGFTTEATQRAKAEIKVLKYQVCCLETHLKIETSEFTEWFSVSWQMSQSAALEVLRPVIESTISEFRGEN